jgi:hypothetical protein
LMLTTGTFQVVTVVWLSTSVNGFPHFDAVDQST